MVLRPLFTQNYEEAETIMEIRLDVKQANTLLCFKLFHSLHSLPSLSEVVLTAQRQTLLKTNSNCNHLVLMIHCLFIIFTIDSPYDNIEWMSLHISLTV